MLRRLASVLTPTPIKKGIKKARVSFYSKKNLKKAKKKYKTGVSINVMFLVLFPEMWNSEKSVFLELKKRKEFNPIIVCLPKLENNKKGVKTYSNSNEAYDFFLKQGIDAINGRVGDAWLNPKTLDPDFVFYQRPYSGELPENYEFSTMIKYSLLCHIPYGFCLSKNIHLKIAYNGSFLNNIQFFFSDSHDVYDYYLENRFCNDNKVFDLGYPRFDLFAKTGDTGDGRVVLWTPRWYFGNGDNNKSSFLVYLDTLISFFHDNQQFSLIIRPHPLMFGFLVKSGTLSSDELERIIERINQEANISIDYEKDYLNSFAKSSVLISDFSSLLAEYFVTGKPILYCGEYEDFNEIGTKISQTFYEIKNEEMLITSLNKVLTGEDEKKQTRNTLIDDLIDRNEKISTKISNVLFESIK